jgi:hypothetical protein
MRGIGQRFPIIAALRPALTRTSLQRVISVGYSLSLAYSCLRVPFTATQDGVAFFRMGYGWLWAGPDNSI